jgi:hypothetical protein
MADPTQTRLSELMTKIEFFNQRQLAKAMGVTTDGYCHAMCLDWIRRALQHQGRSNSMKFRFDDESGSQRTARIVGRQMAMQEQISGKKTALQSKQHQMFETSKVLDQGALDAGSVVKYLAQTLKQNPDFDAFPKSALFPPGKLRDALNTVQAGLFAALPDEMSREKWKGLAFKLNDRRIDQENERDRLRGVAPDLASYAVLFKVSIPTLKSTLENHRSQGKNGSPSSRGFDGISIEQTRNAAHFPTPQGRSVLDTVCGHLEPNQAAMIGFDISSGGHEVAVRLGPDGQNFLFLDPNYGIFRGGRGQLNDAFDFLFDQQKGVYNNSGAPDGGAIKGTFDFTIFQRSDG